MALPGLCLCCQGIMKLDKAGDGQQCLLLCPAPAASGSGLVSSSIMTNTTTLITVLLSSAC